MHFPLNDRLSGKAPWVLLVLKLANGVFVTQGVTIVHNRLSQNAPLGTSEPRGILTLQQRFDQEWVLLVCVGVLDWTAEEDSSTKS